MSDGRTYNQILDDEMFHESNRSAVRDRLTHEELLKKHPALAKLDQHLGNLNPLD